MGRVRYAGLVDLWDDIENDPAFDHLRQPGIRLVPGEGAERPMAMVIGEAPGAQENMHGRPFVGPSGNVLMQLMDFAGLWRSDSRCDPARPANAWVTNVVKYRPPGNRTPAPREQIAAVPYLRREWQLIGAPRLIVCVGAVAQNAITPAERLEKGSIFLLKSGVYVCHQFHPAYGMRGGDARKEMMERQWEQMGALIKELGL